MLLRYKVVIEYDGTQFSGWQNQKNVMTVQGEIEKALFCFTRRNIKIYGASRTDAGVHALGQVAHFELNKLYDINKIQSAVNYYLKPNKISIVNIEKVSDTFHARFSNKTKQYVYKIINRNAPLTLEKNRAWHIVPHLNLNNIKTASQYLIGTFDFTSFRSTGCQSHSAIKTINSIKIIQKDAEISIIFNAKSFLYNQIRIIVGTFKYFGLNKIKPSYMQSIINAKNRNLAGETAPSYGLYLAKIFFTN